MGEHKGTEHDTRSPRRIFGVRLSALLEIIGFLAVTLVFSLLFDAGNRFLNVSPHPFWIPVLLVSAYYGANEGLAAAILSAAALLTGNLPEQGSSEDLSAWLLRVTAEPVLWFVAAIALGQVGEMIGASVTDCVVTCRKFVNRLMSFRMLTSSSPKPRVA